MYRDDLFEWDERKEATNITKHKISFSVAKSAFADPKQIIMRDTLHSDTEERFYCIGKVHGQVIMVRFTYRNDKIRIFGAGAWRQARAVYEKKHSIH